MLEVGGVPFWRRAPIDWEVQRRVITVNAGSDASCDAEVGARADAAAFTGVPSTAAASSCGESAVQGATAEWLNSGVAALGVHSVTPL